MITEDAVKELRKGKKRNFNQTIDLIVSLTNIDMKKPENHVNKEVDLPHGRGKELKILVFSEKEGMGKNEIEQLAKNKKKAKKVADEYDFFLSEPALMTVIGKSMGRYLGPRGKMPKVLPPNADPEKFKKSISKLVRIRAREPNIQVAIATESMKDEEISENIKKVMNELERVLPKGRAQIRNALVKTTMGKPVNIDKW